MAWHLYILPIIGTGAAADTWRPKYLDGKTWTQRPLGSQLVTVVCADLTDIDDATVSAQPDAVRVPDDLDQLLTAADVTRLQALVETVATVPCEWIVVGMSYRTMIRRLCSMADFLRRLRGRIGQGSPLITASGPVTLETTVTSLSTSTRTALSLVATDQKLATLTMTGTVRQLLASVWSQRAQPQTIGGVVV